MRIEDIRNVWMFLAGLTMDFAYVGLGKDRLVYDYVPFGPGIMFGTNFEDLDPMPPSGISF